MDCGRHCTCIDLTRCMPFVFEAVDKCVAVTNVYETLLSITGSGFLSEALLFNQDGNGAARLKITIDGTVILWCNSATQNKACGFTREEYLKGVLLSVLGVGEECVIRSISSSNSLTTTIQPVVKASATYPTFPSSDQQDNICHIFNSSIFFEYSLLIEIATATIANDLSYRLVGGNY